MAHPFRVSGDVGGGFGDDDNANVGGAFTLGTPHGSATWITILAFVVIMFTVGRGVSLWQAIIRAFVFVGIIGAGQIVFGHLAHSYYVSHPDSAIATGLEYNLAGVSS